MDYTGFVDQPVVFPIESSQNDTQCININIVNDNFPETNVENFFAELTISTGTDAVIVPGRERVTISIVDNNDDSKISNGLQILIFTLNNTYEIICSLYRSCNKHSNLQLYYPRAQPT